MAQGKPAITKEMLDGAAEIADVKILDEYKQTLLNGLNGATAGYEQIYALHMPNSVQPALVFDPLPMGWKLDTVAVKMRASVAPAVATKAPKNIEDVAFSSVRELAELVRTK